MLERGHVTSSFAGAVVVPNFGRGIEDPRLKLLQAQLESSPMHRCAS